MSEMNEFPSIAELEIRMRPGAYSEWGFLGSTESFESVMAYDRETLETLGVSYEQIANALENILQIVRNERSNREREDYIPDFINVESIPSFSLENLPSINMGYLVGGDFQVFIAQYHGSQDCPWGCGSNPAWNSFDFLLLNRQTGEYVTGPGMILHLLREHHFFEGLESPYRVDPARVIRVLGLVSKADVK